jgi:hypothetical protein
MRGAGRLLFVALVITPSGASPQGNPVGPEFRVNTYINSPHQLPAVASDSSGNFVVVWQAPDASNFGVFGQRYASTGAPLGPEFSINTSVTLGQTSPAVASDSSGNFVVVWTSQITGGPFFDFDVFGRRYSTTGAPLGPEFRVNTVTVGSQSNPDVASDASGNVVVVWAGDGLTGVVGQRYASTGAPLGPEFRVNTLPANSATSAPAVASDPSGNFVVVWASPDGCGPCGLGVFGQRYASTGAPLGPEFQVNTFTFFDQWFPDVTSDPSGNFVVVWQSYAQDDGNGNGVFGQRYASTGAPLGAEFRVNTYITNHQSEPAVASDASGNFVVVWYSLTQDGSGNGVFGQRYASTGEPLGPEFRVNTYTTADQEFPSVASAPSGNFVILWDSDLQEGSSDNVYGQRYSPIVPVELTRFEVE